MIDLMGKERLKEQGDRPIVEGMTKDQIANLQED